MTRNIESVGVVQWLLVTLEMEKIVSSKGKNVVVEYLQICLLALNVKAVLCVSVQGSFGSQRIYMSKALHTKRDPIVNIWCKFEKFNM